MKCRSTKNKSLWISLLRAFCCMLLLILVSMNLGYYLGQQSTRADWKEWPIERLFVDYRN